jgi:hypothetical protein
METMKKITKPPPTSIRFSLPVLRALDKVASADMRPRAVLVEKIVMEWLQERGHLK